MPRITLENIGRRVVDKRGSKGIRETAKEIGVSPATLSRIERGFLPDLQRFRMVCDWLGVNPGDVLGSKVVTGESQRMAVHFKKERVIKPETARALANMIMAAQRAIEAEEK